MINCAVLRWTFPLSWFFEEFKDAFSRPAGKQYIRKNCSYLFINPDILQTDKNLQSRNYIYFFHHCNLFPKTAAPNAASPLPTTKSKEQQSEQVGTQQQQVEVAI